MMKSGVKWVYQMVKRPGHRSMEAGQKPSLCFRGRQYMLCVSVGFPVRILKRPVTDFDQCRTVLCNGAEYPTAKAVASLREIGARNGITVGASRLLDRALQGVTELDEDSYNDEEDTVESIPKDVDSTEGEVDTSPANDNSSTTETKDMLATNEDTKVTKTAKTSKPAAKTKAPKKTTVLKSKANGTAKPKAAKVAKEPKERKPSQISKAVEYMREQIKKEGGASKLERGYLKELFVKTAEKFTLSPITCGIQYNRQIKNG